MTTLTYAQALKQLPDTSDKNQLFTYKEVEELCDHLDRIQATPEEFDALKDLNYYIQTSKHTDEYESFKQGILIGDFDKDPNEQEYFRKMDRDEMRGDMYAFEDENKTHELFSLNPWKSRTHTSTYDKTNKKSEVSVDASITHIGKDYSTATSEYGKIFVPNHLADWLQTTDKTKEGIEVSIRIRFQGFEGCRKTTLPWRAFSIIRVKDNKDNKDNNDNK